MSDMAVRVLELVVWLAVIAMWFWIGRHAGLGQEPEGRFFVRFGGDK